MDACLTTEEELLTLGTHLKAAITTRNIQFVRKLSFEGLDLGLHLRGETALYMAVRMDQVEMLEVLLEEMEMQKTLGRSINSYSVDSAGRKEKAFICAVRNGLNRCVSVLADSMVDMEMRDGEGHTALWHAVREQKVEMVEYLVMRGAIIFYKENDISCPLLLACKTALLKESGQQMARFLMSHGANIEYQDLALRNILFWVVYNNNLDLACLIVKYGPRIEKWSWMEHQFLPQQLKMDKILKSLSKTSIQPRSLIIQSSWVVRCVLSKSVGGRSIVGRIDSMDVDGEVKQILKWEV
jgi:hypothetical protein